MKGSPEFRRNLWLEFTPQRLIAMPVILGAVFLLVTLGGRRVLDESTGTVAAFAFIVLIFLWGTRLAAETVIVEVHGRTWDQQRLSAIGAWQMAWGKLFGAPAYAWYGGLICMVFYALSRAAQLPPGVLLSAVALYIAAGVMAHALSLLLSLQAVLRRRAFGRVQVLGYQVIAVVPAGMALYGGLDGLGGNGGYAMTVWFGFSMTKLHFALAAVAAFAAWALAGTYALIRLEMMHRHGPWAWLGFVVFAMVFFSGLDYLPWRLPVTLTALPEGPSVAFLIAAAAAYAMAFAEPKHRVRFRQLTHFSRAGQWRRVLELAPRSVLTLALAGGAAVAAGALADTTHFSNIASLSDIRLSVLATFLFAVRDIGFVYVISLKHEARAGGGEAQAFLFLVLAYTLLPALVQALSFGPLLAFAWPQWGEPPFWTIGAPLIEVCVVGYLLRRQLRSAG
jgi:hypothetical protein